MTGDSEDNKTSADLLPCPFCGGEAELEVGERSKEITRICCVRCGIGTGITMEPGSKRIIKAWNRRVK